MVLEILAPGVITMLGGRLIPNTIIIIPVTTVMVITTISTTNTVLRLLEVLSRRQSMMLLTQDGGEASGVSQPRMSSGHSMQHVHLKS